MRYRKRDVAGWVVAFVASLVVGTSTADAAKWTPAKLAAHAHGNPWRCKVAPDWGPKQNRCVVRVVWQDRPAIGRQAERIIDCETGGTWDERSVNPDSGAAGLAQFLRSTWRRYRYRIHSRLHPVYSVLQMRVVRMADGHFGQWACRP